MHQRPNTIEIIDADEEKLIEVKKHPFGIIIVYIQTVIGLVAATAVTFLALPSVINDTDSAVLLGSVFLLLILFIAGAVLMVSTYIYRQNSFIVTDRNITQILQSGLFTRKVSQLNIVNVEDVTAVQDGFISTAFNYGILRIETAGEQSNFDFTFCPNCGYVAKLILDAREKMLGQMDDEEAPVDVKTSRVRRKRGGTSAKKPSTSTAAAKPGKPYVGNADDVAQVKTVGGGVVKHSKRKK